MNAELEVKLIECLSALDAGESLDQALARFPGDAAELRPMLAVATALPTFRQQPSEAQKLASREKFLSQAAALRKAAAPRRTFLFGAAHRLASTLAALALIFVVLSGGAVAASGSALPGDPLYGLKRAVEDVRLALTLNSTARTDLQNTLEQTRVREANALLDAGRETEVAFRGPIESIQPNSWIVAGLVVRVTAETQIVGQPQLDRVAQVRGVTGVDGLSARSIIIEGGDDQTPVSTPSSIPSAPIVTLSPTATPSPEPTELRPTREAPPTPSPTRVPTAVPTTAPVEIEFTGTVDSQGDTWSISGAAVVVNADTQFDGNIGVGQRVQVTALRFADGRLVAQRIKLLEDSGNPPPNNNQNHNGNDDHNDNENHNNNENRNGNENHNSNNNHNDNENSNGNDNNKGD
ncbi:MAG: DUF5666 domain-containing protein [Anaerolineae bacterium]